MTFNAAKDLVYTMNRGTISSGGYRISNILNGKSKKKGKQTHMSGGNSNGYGSDIFKEDSGISIGLLLLQRLHHYDGDDGREDGGEERRYSKHKDKEPVDTIDSNRKLVYASIMTESDHDDDGDDDKINNIELVITPSGIVNPIEISSNEIDDELYDSLVKSVSESESAKIKSLAPAIKVNTTKKQNFGKHKDIEKIFQKRRTRSKRHQ
jgi:hypothetical protein